jgi:hypothetical protein
MVYSWLSLVLICASVEPEVYGLPRVHTRVSQRGVCGVRSRHELLLGRRETCRSQEVRPVRLSSAPADDEASTAESWARLFSLPL